MGNHEIVAQQLAERAGHVANKQLPPAVRVLLGGADPLGPALELLQGLVAVLIAQARALDRLESQQ